MNVNHLVRHAKVLLNENASTLLTGVGVVGTVGTAYFTGRATFKAADLIAKETAIINIAVEGNTDPVWLTKKDKVKLVWKPYMPAVGVGAITIGAIIFAHRIDAKKIVALTVASGISERALKEYKEKVVEKLGDRHDTKIRDEIAQDRVSANPPGSSEVLTIEDGKVMCYDMNTGRYFKSTVEEIKSAENTINFEIVQQLSVSLSRFYEEIGLAPTTYSDNHGWHSNNLLSVDLSTTMTPDNRPCIAISFNPEPVHDYDKLWK